MGKAYGQVRCTIPLLRYSLRYELRTGYIIVGSRVVIREKTRQSPPADLPDVAVVLAQLDRILSTSWFQHSKRYPAFLRHVVEQTLRGAGDELKERTLGIVVFRRSPEYDTSADPVVRNTASEVRKRLEEYYSEPGHEKELRITLPPGAYIPEFREAEGNGSHLGNEPQVATFLSGAKRSRTGIIAVSAMALLVIVATVALFPRKSALQRFWAPILQTSGPVLVVEDTLVALREPPAESQAGPAQGSETRETIDPKTYLNVSEEAAKLGAFFIGQGKQLEFQLARNAGLATLRRRPFILRGAFNNQWTPRAVSPFRFYLQLDHNPIVRRIIDRQNPTQRDWSAPMTSHLTEDYALIARAPEPETGQTMVVIAGLGEKGSAAALEFVTNPKYFDRFAAEAPAGWDRGNIELVIKTDLVNDDWGEPHVVAKHFW